MNWQGLLASTLLLFAIVNPIGSIPIFLQLTQGMSEAERRRTFLIAVLVSALILFAFIALGEGILTRFFQVELHDLKAAGGLLLLIIAIDHLVFGSLVRSVTRDEGRD
ncbi:MAG: MarC family protein, partial [Planctomycetota bacterium]